MILVLLLLLLFLGGLELFFSCFGTLIAIVVIIALLFFAAWLMFYAAIVLLVFYAVFIIWRWLINDHPQLARRLNLDRLNAWIIRVNNGQTRQNVFILLIMALIIIWLIRK
ncbi:hypothetical protein MOO44_03595 [Nicoliella spurrieriana]|uniref:Uncharacterized protein n=1 Tax=Nicoliella spurrieriana TaxID=2925830 RepID=A0A976X633_9LACO|nr:hypothetical protein [Nicoliella spurrieriana]UQS87254.1 hypothetical protein MOO44_03595 [Nicoliella spurrieriana]